MVLTVQYTPKTGINAGKQCFPVTCGNMFKSGLYRLEKTEADGNVKVEFAEDIIKAIEYVEKGYSLRMAPPDGIPFLVTAEELIRANPETFWKVLPDDAKKTGTDTVGEEASAAEK